MGGDWTKALLGDICQLKAGGAFKKELQGNSHGELPFIKVSDMNLAGNELYIKNANNWVSKETAKNIRAPIHPAGAVVFAKIGVALTYNRRRILTRDTLIDNNMMSATPDAKHVDPRFFYYLLVNIDFNKIVEGSALPYLKASTINSIDVLIPNISEQRAIAHILGTLDDKIELNRQMNRTLEAMAQALFKSWFIDFDPVVVNALRAGNPVPEKFAQRAAHYCDNPDVLRLPEDTLRQFPDRFQDSELGPIPEGWEVSSIYTTASVTYGAPFKSKLFNTERKGTPLIRIRDLKTHFPQNWTTERHPKGTKVYPGDILVGMDGEFRAVLWQGEPGWLNQRVCMFTPREGVSRAYIYFVIQEHLDFHERSKTGTTVIHLGKRDIDGFRIVLPDTRVTGCFQPLADSLLETIIGNGSESRTLEKLRDTLLPKLISGELRVPDAEKLVEEAL